MSSLARPRWETISSDSLRGIKSRILVVAHRDDTCRATPYAAQAKLAQGRDFVSVRGGKPPESPPCDPFSPHGFFGKEPETVDAITAWMLGKPFAKEIE